MKSIVKPRGKKRSTRRPERPAEIDTATHGQGKQKPRGRVNAYFTHHLWVLVSTLGGLWRTPLATLMTAAVIGIAIAKGGRNIRFNILGQVVWGWISTPVAAAVLSFVLLFFVFAPQIFRVFSADPAVVAEGTGWRAALRRAAVCGKTGSSQVVSSARLERSPA